MGLFDTIREKAAELLSGVTEKAGDLPGDLAGELPGDLPGAETLNDLSQSASEAAIDAAGSVTDAADEPPQPE